VYIEGRLKYGKYTDKDGIERNTVDIVANEMQLLGGRQGMGQPSEEGASSGGAGGGGGYTQRERPASAPSSSPAKKPAAKPASGFDDMDDDIPF
jgi:single-strand DNA-binding protein